MRMFDCPIANLTGLASAAPCHVQQHALDIVRQHGTALRAFASDTGQISTVGALSMLQVFYWFWHQIAIPDYKPFDSPASVATLLVLGVMVVGVG